MHTSIPASGIELIDLQSSEYSPLISKCKIKVCYVSDQPNRNKSVITKEVAKQMAPSLRGSVIVGHYSKEDEDFEEHNKIIEIKNGEFNVISDTVPYGFVDINAKVWFQKFLDDDQVEREYLVTEGYLWTEQFPECKRVIEKGNNQSMELDRKTVKGSWANSENGKPEFFIINEAIISKLCILGEDVEPCFEGAQIATNFTIDENFKEQVFSMIKEIKDLIEGGKQMYNQFAVEIGDALWCSLYKYLTTKYPNEQDIYTSAYCVEGIYEDNGEKFAILRKDNEYFKLNIYIANDKVTYGEELVEVTKTFTPTNQFAQADIDAFIENYKAEEEKAKAEEAKKKEEEEKAKENACGGTNTPAKEEKKKKEYSLEEIPEYIQLKEEFDSLQKAYNNFKANFKKLSEELKELREFKAESELKEKNDLIDSFYMLNDEDKKEVRDNINEYSYSEIEAKLSIICVRNKVSFVDDNNVNKVPETTYNLNNGELNDSIPAWVKSIKDVKENKEEN